MQTNKKSKSSESSQYDKRSQIPGFGVGAGVGLVVGLGVKSKNKYKHDINDNKSNTYETPHFCSVTVRDHVTHNVLQ